MAKRHTGLDPKRWQTVRRRVFDRDRWRCRQCGRAGRLECDHIIPLAEGGKTYAVDNLQTLCRGCHIRKTAGENQAAAARRFPQSARWKRAVSDLM